MVKACCTLPYPALNHGCSDSLNALRLPTRPFTRIHFCSLKFIPCAQDVLLVPANNRLDRRWVDLVSGPLTTIAEACSGCSTSHFVQALSALEHVSGPIDRVFCKGTEATCAVQQLQELRRTQEHHKSRRKIVWHPLFAAHSVPGRGVAVVSGCGGLGGLLLPELEL